MRIPAWGLCLAALSAPVFGQRAKLSGPPLDPTAARPRPFLDPHELLHGGVNLHASVTAVANGDLDGDGALDLVVCQASNGTFFIPYPSLVYRNDGTGVLRARQNAFLGHPHGSFDLGVGDLDGDGDVDLVVPPYLTRPFLYVNDGRARFSEASAALPDTGPLHSLELADVDGDGDLDIHWDQNDTDLLHLNDGSGSFVDASDQLAPDPFPHLTMRFGDVDGDGDLDLVSGARRLYENDGAGVFSDVSDQIPGTGSRAFELGDLDGDGNLDIGALAFTKLNDGTGHFTAQTLSSVYNEPTGLVDVDGDDDLDLLGVQDLWLNDGNASFTWAGPQLPPFAEDVDALGIGDYDGDGDVDVFVPLTSGSGVGWLAERYLLLNDGSGTFVDSRAVTEEVPRRTAYDSFPCLFPGDVDGDGFEDLIETCSIGLLILNRNDGAGRFTPSSIYPPDPTEVRDLRVLDLDDDGDNDVLFAGDASPGGGGVRWYRNEGLSFSLQTTPVGANIRKIDVGDVEGDGDPDVVTAGSARSLLLNGGDGSFTIAAGLPDVYPSSDVRFIDAEQDGDLDVLSADSRLRLFVNDGMNGFTDESAARLQDGSVYSIATGDVDDDGDTDILSALGSQGARLDLNDGTGVFADGSDRLGSIPYTRQPFLVDVDDDGDLDVVLDSVGLRNDGTGRFDERLTLEIRPAAFGDFDGDGDVDELPFASVERDPAVNLTRQIAWHAPPSIGKELQIDLYGPPRTDWILSYALAPAYLPTSYGTRFLDPATLHPAGAGTLDYRGKDFFRVLVPADTSLVGTTLHWQALVGSPPRFTNRETTNFTNL